MSDCPHHYKCHSYYCVPYKYTCDSKYDCPLGDDENNCANRTCPGLFKCKGLLHGLIQCIHYVNVEDDIIDCKDGDDEIFTGLSACPMSCNCLMNSLKRPGHDCLSEQSSSSRPLGQSHIMLQTFLNGIQ